MRINNNIMAMNTHRQLNIAVGSVGKSMEKLSSGYGSTERATMLPVCQFQRR